MGQQGKESDQLEALGGHWWGEGRGDGMMDTDQSYSGRAVGGHLCRRVQRAVDCGWGVGSV